ncbi:MAG: hypothetical protein HUU02_17135, partial [Bacteroidetes bacterium]|nr:hypothetical protein [Bacteroidota bacterium]
GQVDLDWDDNSESDFAKYYIYGGTNSNPTTLIDSTTSIAASFRTIVGLSNYTTYYFRITAKDTSGNVSAYSLEATATPTDGTPPGPVSLVSAYGTDGTVSLKWNMSLSTDVNRYRIFLGTSSPATSLFDSTLQRNDTLAVLSGLTNGTVYYSRIIAVDSNGNASVFSNEQFTTPVAPDLAAADNDGSTRLLLHLNETSGTTTSDHSSFNNNGLASGTTIVTGRSGPARELNGSGDHIAVADAASLQHTDLTAEGWFRFNSTVGVMTLISKTIGSGMSDSYILYYANGSLNGVTGDIGGTGTILSASWTPVPGQWYHIAYTLDDAASTHSLYVDGVRIASGSASISMGFDGHPVLVGAEYENEVLSSFFHGAIDEVRVSDIVRNPVSFKLQLPPVAVSANGIGTSVSVTWSNGGGGTPLMRYRIYRGADSTTLTLIDSVSTTSYGDTGLPYNTQFFYRVAAVDSTGFESVRSYAASATTQSVTATFQVDMRTAVQWARFNPATDSVIVRGSKLPLAWTGSQHVLTDPDNDSVYTLSVAMSGIDSLEYKYLVLTAGRDRWERETPLNQNRLAILSAGAQNLPLVSFDDLPVYAHGLYEY